MHTNVPNHEPGLLMMNSGNIQPIRPCLGSWASYGLGTGNPNLPSFVSLCPGLPVVGPQLWSNSFLPGEYQATAIDTNNMTVEKLIANIKHPNLGRSEQRKQLDLLQRLNQIHMAKRQNDPTLETQIKAMELAFEMQREAAEVFDISREPDYIHKAYGNTIFSKGCLLARRLVENGVRFVQIHYVTSKNKQPWDTHSDNNNRHRELCSDSDKATAALITDLKQRGMLEDTLIIWGGEFGRTPYAQPNKNKKKIGRDHHHTGFSMFLAGGGTKGGTVYGATDEFGMNAVENRIHVHDLHATILHLLGLDHERLTYRYSGRDFRLTDVHGRVVNDIIA
jgi:arylsulfatase A-like enzyme